MKRHFAFITQCLPELDKPSFQTIFISSLILVKYNIGKHPTLL